MPRPPTKKVNPRQIVPGLLIRTPGNGIDDIVRDVFVVLRLQNGAELTYSSTDEVLLLEDQPQLLDPEEIAPT